jgi:hypothetical protein
MINNLVGSRTIVPLLSSGNVDDAQAVWKERRHRLGQELPESLVAHDGFITKVAAEIELDLRPGFERGAAPVRCGCLASLHAEQAKQHDVRNHGCAKESGGTRHGSKLSSRRVEDRVSAGQQIRAAAVISQPCGRSVNKHRRDQLPRDSEAYLRCMSIHGKDTDVAMQ